jgi:hypothetical protein
LESGAARVIFGSRRKDLVEEEWVLETTLNRFDEERSEVPGVRSTVRKRLAFGEVGAESRFEFLKAHNRSVVSDAVIRVDLLDSRKLLKIRTEIST